MAIDLEQQQKLASLVHRQSIELQQKVNELSIVRRVSEELIRAISLEDACQRFINIILSEIHVENCSVMILEEGVLIIKAARGQMDSDFTSRTGQTFFRLGEGIAGQVALTRESILIQDTRTDTRFTIRKNQTAFVGSLFCIPLIDQQRTIGVLNLSTPETEAFKVEHERVLAIIANQSAVILAKLQLEDALQKAHEALRSSEEQFRLTAATSRDLICITDSQHRVIFSNQSFEKLLGFAPEELQGKSIEEYIDESSRNEIKLIIEELNQNHIIIPCNIRLFRKNGDPIEMEGSFTQFMMSDGRIHFVFNFRDLSERLELQAQILKTQKMEAVTTLAGGIAHDFNNLIGIIIPYTDLIKRSTDLQRILKYVNHINDAAYRAAKLTRELLHFARPEKILVETLDLNGIVKNTADLLIVAILENIAVNVNLSKSGLFIKGDGSQLGQVIMNLGLNARDAIPENQNGWITVTTGQTFLTPDKAQLLQVPAGEYVYVEISDSGVGIPEDIMPKIFEPFFTTKSKEKGTGLGLAMVFSVVKNHGGTITTKSTVGKGSTFTVFLPKVEELPKQLITEIKDIPSGTETVLVIDDVEGVRKMVHDVLESYGYTVLEANGGLSAITIFKEKHSTIDVVLLDMKMPGLDGKETYLRLKDINPHVPVILSSGFVEDGENVQELLSMGLAGFLKKPYANRDLLLFVRNAIDQKQSAH